MRNRTRKMLDEKEEIIFDEEKNSPFQTNNEEAKSSGFLKNDWIQSVLTKFNFKNQTTQKKSEEIDLMPKKNLPVEEKNKISNLKKNRTGSFAKHSSKIVSALLVFGVIIILVVSVVATYLIDIYNSVDSKKILENTPYQSSIVYARDGQTELFRIYGEENRKYLKLDRIPTVMQYAMIGLEDENFYYNETGIPWKNLLGASIKCAMGDSCRGASGLAQQLVKNVTKDDVASIDRKVRELFTAIKLNKETSHDEILEFYLNQVPFGRNAYGVEMASQSYFGKPVAQINPAEACFLAALPQSPSVYSLGIDARNNPESDYYVYWETLQYRQENCLEKLNTVKVKEKDSSPYLNNEDKEKWLATEVEFKPKGFDVQFPHWRDYIVKELNKFVSDAELQTNGYKIITTLDVNLQRDVEKIIADNLQTRVISAGANNAAAVVLDGPSGEILAMVGSRDYGNLEIDGQVNIVTSPKPPGSTFKAYVYAAAMDAGFSPGTVLLDSKTDFGGGYAPENYGGNRGYGLVTMRAALQRSLNISTIKAALLVAGEGLRPDADKSMKIIMDFSKKLGLNYPNESCAIYLSATLGSCDVTMISHTTAHNTFGQEGTKYTATPFISIVKVDADGSELDVYKRTQSSSKPVYKVKKNAIDPLIARQITNVLSDNSVRNFGTSESQLVFPGYVGAVAAKTGTSSDDDNRPTNLWTVGYTTHRAVSVWVGNTKDSPTQKLNWNASGVGSATPIWNSIMRIAHKDLERKNFSTSGLSELSTSCPAGTIGCKTELVTKKQLDRINSAFNSLSKNDFETNKSSIFSFANEVVMRNLKVSLLDNKLVNASTYPEKITKDYVCYEAPTSFPTLKTWLEVGERFVSSKAGDQSFPICPKEFSDIEVSVIEAGVEFDKEFKSGVSMPASLGITGIANIPQTSIKKITLKVSGEVLAESNSSTLDFDATKSALTGSKPVQVLIEDSLGLITEFNYTNITFNYPPTPIETSDLSLLQASCGSMVAGSTTNCSISIPKYKTFPSSGLKIYIGNNSTPTACYTTGGGVAKCDNVPTLLTDLGTQPIRLQVGNGNVVLLNDEIVLSSPIIVD